MKYDAEGTPVEPIDRDLERRVEAKLIARGFMRAPSAIDIETDLDQLAFLSNQLSDRCGRYRDTLVEIHPIAVCIALDETANPIDREWAAKIVEKIDAALANPKPVPECSEEQADAERYADLVGDYQREDAAGGA